MAQLTKSERAEREALQRLNQIDAAALLGITPRALRDRDDVPRNADGTYHGQALVLWASLRTAKGQPVGGHRSGLAPRY